MGKKKTAPPTAPGATDHFSDYGFDTQLLQFFSQIETKRPSIRRQQPPPPALDSVRFKLQKPISKKKHHHHNNNKQQEQQQHRRRRWWWSSAAFLLFKRPSTSPSSNHNTKADPAFPYGSSSPAVPLYMADADCCGEGDTAAACACCWAPAVRSDRHRLAAAEIGAASVPYVSLRNADLGRGTVGGGPPPAMPIYLVT